MDDEEDGSHTGTGGNKTEENREFRGEKYHIPRVSNNDDGLSQRGSGVFKERFIFRKPLPFLWIKP